MSGPREVASSARAHTFQQRHMAYLGLGSNLGDRTALCRSALDELGRGEATELVATSSLYETSPWGKTDQEPFINAVASVSTILEPKALLDRLQEIETHRGGRRRRARWGPRTLDLDLLFFDDALVRLPGLTVPHPRMHERLFVLVPLEEIAPFVVHPALGRTVRDLRIGCPDRGTVELVMPTPLLRSQLSR